MNRSCARHISGYKRMKKYIGILAMTIVVCSFASCGSSDSLDNKQTEDTTTVLKGRMKSEGFGRCSESGCHCKAFKGRGQTCANCGHAYKKHY